MKLTIFAATGGIGRQILDQALAAGHTVTAVARNPKSLAEYADRLRIVTADLTSADPAVLESAVSGADAVLSGLGPRNPKTDAGITSRGTRAIVAADASHRRSAARRGQCGADRHGAVAGTAEAAEA